MGVNSALSSNLIRLSFFHSLWLRPYGFATATEERCHNSYVTSDMLLDLPQVLSSFPPECSVSVAPLDTFETYLDPQRDTPREVGVVLCSAQHRRSLLNCAT